MTLTCFTFACIYQLNKLPKRSCNGRHDLTDESIQIRIGWSVDIQISPADVVYGLVIRHERTVRMIKCRVSGQDGVVWLHYGRRDLRGGVDGVLEFAFLAVVDGYSLHEKRSEARPGPASE